MILVRTFDETKNLFIDGCPITANDDHMNSPVDLVKTLIFDDLAFEGSYICQDIAALQIPLIVMSGPHTLDEIHEELKTRVFQN